mmetsp:Transcript_31917/g.70138  ORF Transcript_31917/g.70138 Transcript_31917/m.70138 type:complete len:630 (-) Transcript_31917:196-2085(-)
MNSPASGDDELHEQQQMPARKKPRAGYLRDLAHDERGKHKAGESIWKEFRWEGQLDFSRKMNAGGLLPDKIQFRAKGMAVAEAKTKGLFFDDYDKLYEAAANRTPDGCGIEVGVQALIDELKRARGVPVQAEQVPAAAAAASTSASTSTSTTTIAAGGTSASASSTASGNITPRANRNQGASNGPSSVTPTSSDNNTSRSSSNSSSSGSGANAATSSGANASRAHQPARQNEAEAPATPVRNAFNGIVAHYRGEIESIETAKADLEADARGLRSRVEELERQLESEKELHAATKDEMKEARRVAERLERIEAVESNDAEEDHFKGIDDKHRKVAEAMRVLPYPGRGPFFKDIIGLEDIKEIFGRTIRRVNHPEEYRGKDIDPRKGFLMFGPSGTGKTMMAKAFANELGLHFYHVNICAVLSKWVGEGEKVLEALFACARSNSTKEIPSVIFIDEMDSLCSDRHANNTADSTGTTFKNKLLELMDGFSSSDQHWTIVIGATNHPRNIDMGFRNRLSKAVLIPLPSQDDREAFFRKKLGKYRHDLTDERFKALAESAEGFSGRELHAICNEELEKCVDDSIVEAEATNQNTSTACVLKFDDMVAAIKSSNPMTRQEEVDAILEWNDPCPAV